MIRKSSNAYGIDEKLAAKIDKLIEAVLNGEYGEDFHSIYELFEDYMGGMVSNAAFYVVDKLTARISNLEADDQFIYEALIILSCVKPMLWSCDLMSYSEDMRISLFQNLYRLNRFGTVYFDSNIMTKSDRDQLVYLGMFYMMLMTYSNELIPIFNLWPFDKNLTALCPYCGNVSEVGVDDDIDEAEGPDYYESVMEMWNVFTATDRYLTTCEEKYLRNALSRLYGTKKCPCCGNESKVIVNVMEQFYASQSDVKEPSDELIEWVGKYGNTLRNKSYEEMLFFHQMALYYLHSKRSCTDTELAKAYIRLSIDHTFLNRFDVQIDYAKHAVEIMESGTDELTLAESYRNLGNAYKADYINPENNEPDIAMEYFNKALEIFDRVLGEGNEKSQLVQQNIAVMIRDMQGDPGEHIGKLKKQIKEEKAKTEPDLWKIADTYKTIADLYAEGMGNYKKAVHYYEYYLKQAKITYGEESDFVADCYEEMAEYYELMDDVDGACQLYEKALEINIREMGKSYMLPPIFKGLVDKVLKFTGQMDEKDKYMRSISAADSFMNVGDMYKEKGDYKKALDCFNKSLELRKWVVKVPTSEEAYNHEGKAEVYRLMGSLDEAKSEYRAALIIYKATADRNNDDGNPVFEGETEECEKKIIKLIKILDKM